MRVLTSKADNEIVLIEVEGEVDAHTAGELDGVLRDLLAQDHSRLVLDVSQMGFISSAGLRAIVFAYREACQRGGQVRLCGLDGPTRRIFEMAGLDECLHLSETREEAMAGW